MASLVLAGCGSDGSGSTVDTTTIGSTDVTVDIGDVGSIGDIGAEAIDDANSVSCDLDRQAVEMAVDAYTALNGEPPATIEDLVPEFLRSISPNYFVGANGAVEVYDGPCGGFVS